MGEKVLWSFGPLLIKSNGPAFWESGVEASLLKSNLKFPSQI